eukprot:472989-Pleurochrysis_carterae.AAC.2
MRADAAAGEPRVPVAPSESCSSSSPSSKSSKSDVRRFVTCVAARPWPFETPSGPPVDAKHASPRLEEPSPQDAAPPKKSFAPKQDGSSSSSLAPRPPATAETLAPELPMLVACA